MITINKEHMDETRIGNQSARQTDWEYVDIIGTQKPNQPKEELPADTDATQRVFVSPGSITATPAQATSQPQNQPATPRRRNSTHTEQRSAAQTARKKKEKITLIAVCSVAAVVLIAIIAILIGSLSNTSDNGLILNNVYAAGVDLGGMTKEQAESALYEATDNTYSVLDMTVQVLDTTITLSPKDTGVYLDVEAVAQAAYDFGRTGTRAQRQQAQKLVQSSTYVIDLDNYLTLDRGFVQNAVNNLGQQFSTTLSQTTYKIEGQRPTETPDPDTIDLNKTYQTLTIQIGNAEYGLKTDRLFEQIIDAYSANLFQVTGECSVIAPDDLDCEALFNQFCTAPVDATMDAETYVVTPEVYGYGFRLEQLKKMVAEANYGETLTVPMHYIEPDITSKIISEDLFQNVLAVFQTPVSSNADWNTNMELVCNALNGMIIKAGEAFSFNTAVGEPTQKLGYKVVPQYVGKTMTNVVGGGISQVSSALYSCALLADLQILERNAHAYCPTFVNRGYDAQVYYGTMDMRFKNTTKHPIRIEAVITGGYLKLQLVGTDSKDYTVEIVHETTKTKAPGTDTVTLPKNNPNNHKDGDILSPGITGYNVSTYKRTYDKETGRAMGKELIATSSYAKRNKVVVSIVEITPAPTPSESETASPTETGAPEGAQP